MKYLRIIIILFGVCLVASCYNRQTRTSLDEAEGLMEAYPDSALHRLMRIDTSMVRYGEDRARYALLMSMALDKNYIDTTTFDILQPAIDYYLKKGNPKEKLRTYYYQGRIYQNREDRDNALSCFMKGLDNISENNDSLCIARTLVAQGQIYLDFCNVDGYVASLLDASKIYRKNANFKNQLFECLLGAFDGTLILRDKHRADSLLNILLIDSYSLDENQKKLLQGCILDYYIKFTDIEKIRYFIESQSSAWAIDTNGLLNLARAYNLLGEQDKAVSVLSKINESGLTYDTIKYEIILTWVYRDQHNYKDAFYTQWDFRHKMDSIDVIKLEYKSRQQAKIHQLELETVKNRAHNDKVFWLGVSVIAGLALIIIILILILRNIKGKRDLAQEKAKVAELENERLQSERDLAEEKAKVAELENERLQTERDLAEEKAKVAELENERLKDVAELERQKAITAQLEAENMAHRIETLEQESESIRKLLDEEKDVSPQLRKAIQERMAMLNAHLAYYITDNESHNKPYDEWIKELTANREEFMDSTRLAFKASYPKFIKYFEDHGLSVQEINYVCLYAIGLNGVEVGRYMNRPGHINISSTIRKKLKIDKHQSNIGVYVRRLRESLKD